MKYKLAIFDMDGTILDTLVDLANAVNHALAEKNLPQRSLMEIRSYLGNGMLNLIRLSAPKGASDAEISELKDIFTNYYKAHCAENTKPYSGILELIAELRAQGVKTAVVSNKPDFGVQLLVEEHFPTSFDFAVGEKEGIAKKPAPESVKAVLEKLNISLPKFSQLLLFAISFGSLLLLSFKNCIYLSTVNLDLIKYNSFIFLLLF